MPSVVLVLCLALSLACLAASNRGVTRKLERIEERVEHMEARQDRANIARREDKEEIFLKLDDIEALVNSSESGRISFDPTQRADDESQRASEMVIVQKAFAEEKTRWRREASKMKDTIMDVQHEVKASIDKLDSSVNKNIKSLKDSINGNKDIVLDEMKNVKDDTVATCEQNSKFVLDKLSNLERTVNNVMHEVKAVIESEMKHDVKSLNISINSIKDDLLDEMKHKIDDVTATGSQNSRKLDSVIEKQSSMAKLMVEHVSKSEIFSSCLEIYRAGGRTSGVYDIYPAPGQPSITVYCDMDTDGGGWTVFQRRQDGSVDFFRNWEGYAQGFGKPDGEFWLGNEHISALTNTTCCSELRVDLEDFDGNRAYAKYSKFQVAPREDNFRLEVIGYSGNASDSLTAYHSGMEFSTKDRDNDKATTGSCAEFYSGAWWFSDCYRSHLNGLYLHGENKNPKRGVEWFYWKPKYSLKLTEMKIRST